MVCSPRVALIATLLFLTVPATATTDNSGPASSPAATPFAVALQSGDPAPLRALFSDDVYLMPPFSPSLVGDTDAAAYFTAFAQRFAVESYQRHPIESLDLDTRRVDCGAFAITFTHRETGERHTLAGKYQHIWVTPSDAPPSATRPQLEL